MTAVVEFSLRVLGFVVAMAGIIGSVWYLCERSLRRAGYVFKFVDFMRWKEGAIKNPPIMGVKVVEHCERCDGQAPGKGGESDG